MKRLFITVCAAMVAYSAFAIEEADFSMMLVASNATESNIVQMKQSGMYTNEKNEGETYALISSASTAVNLYARADYGDMSIMYNNQLMGTYLGFTTNSCTAYTMYFDLVSGHRFYLKDHYNNDSLILIENGGSYDFTAVATSTFTDRFEVMDYMTYHREVANGNWGTICFPYKWFAMDGVAKLYTLTAKNTAGTKVALDEVALANVVAGKPYFFQSDSTAQNFHYYPVKMATKADSVNGLIGTFVEISETTEEKWVLTKNTITPAAVGSTVGQYRCYIDLELTPKDDTKFVAGAPGRLIFNVVGATTDLEAAEAADMKDGKMIIDGKLVIIKDGKMFNAQGAQL